MTAQAASTPVIHAAADLGWPDDVPTVRLTPLRTRPTRRLALYLVLGLALYAGGANTHAALVLLLSAVILGTIPWAWASVARAARRVEAARQLPDSGVMGEPGAAQLWVRAPATGAVVVRDDGTGMIAAVGSLAGGVRLSGSTVLGRGEAGGGTVHVDLTDRFGLVRRSAVGDVPGACLVLPAVLSARSGIAETAQARTARAGRALRSAVGAETIGTREYRAGDRPRTVHWRATARHGQLVVRELADDAQPRVEVMIDGGQWTQAGLDRAAVVAATVAYQSAQAGIPTIVACDGTAASWGDAARRHLALLPPHAGAAPRILAPPPQRDGDVVLRLGTDGARVTAHLDIADRAVDLGALSCDSEREEVEAWLAGWPRR